MKAEIMRYTFEEEFRLDHPEGVGERGSYFYLDNYKDWLEVQLIEARKQLALYNVVGQSEQLGDCNFCNNKAVKIDEDGFEFCAKCLEV